MTDFRAFLAPTEPLVLPYFGGTRVDAAARRLRVEVELAPGWWRFRVDRRRAVPLEPAAPAELGALPAVRGHWVNGWVVASGRELARVALPPDDEPPPLARVTARRWHSGDLVFDGVDFEDDAEVRARRALEDAQPLGDVPGVAPSLRTAFGLALGAVIAAELGVAAEPRELMPAVVAIADRGRDGLREWAAELAAERARHEAAASRRAAELRLAEATANARPVERNSDPRRRADDALDGARARMLACRSIEGGHQLDVKYDVDGVRIQSIVDARSLQVIDPGVCLGHGDDYCALTLDAMPSVVREAIATHALNITRR